jgi:hypothetical protein
MQEGKLYRIRCKTSLREGNLQPGAIVLLIDLEECQIPTLNKYGFETYVKGFKTKFLYKDKIFHGQGEKHVAETFFEEVDCARG